MKKIADDRIIDATDIIADKDFEKILIGTRGRPLSAIELNKSYGIPIATCFKKVRILEEMGLLKQTGLQYFADGKTVKLYEANLENAYVFYDSGRLKVRFEVVLSMVSGIRRRVETNGNQL